jgi:hypothetical protein
MPKKGHPRVALLLLFHGGEKQSPCGLCAVAKAADIESLAQGL